MHLCATENIHSRYFIVFIHYFNLQRHTARTIVKQFLIYLCDGLTAFLYNIHC